MQHSKPGFTFIEIIVVLLIIGILAGIGVPALQNRLPGFKRNEFITEFNALINFAWQQSLATHKTHQINIDINKRLMAIKVETDQKSRDGQSLFKALSDTQLPSDYIWPENIQFKQFFVDGKDMMRGIQTEEMWFFVVPDGMVQPVIMNLIDTADEDARGEPVQFSLVVNPFTAQVKTYDTFQKP